jgi:cellulose synthase/poly-beta-1,6-N-acetylglucosamine synthase-like glycosyltransferase
MAHNEEDNMAALLERTAKERPPGIEITRILVVSSGSTDRTDSIVQDFMGTDPRVLLLVQPQRLGKNAAINLFLKECAAEDFVVLLSGDILPESGAIGKLLLSLSDEEVGMAGGRPMPDNSKHCFFGFASHLIWEIHHRIALKSPKLGEAVAFKKVVDSLPEDLAVDEAALEALILKKGFRLHYCPDAIIRNRGADNLEDFLKQRRRIQVGHLHLRKKLGYEVSTFGISTGLRALFGVMPRSPKLLLWTLLTCLLLLWGRILGAVDYYFSGKRHAIWDIAQSTKGALGGRSVKG